MDEESKILLPHHEQQPLCTTRLPYRQGRKLTAVKVYTIANESNHLLIFGVPALNLRQETKNLFMKFGKLTKFSISKQHEAEKFTETYHAQFERIQSARIAKRMLDTKNFYGGSLHVCYAPEFESIQETRHKLLQRQKDVLFRLKNLQAEEKNEIIGNEEAVTVNPVINIEKPTINMGEINVISTNKKKGKQKKPVVVIEKKFEPCFLEPKRAKLSDNIEIVDFTSVEKETITNINEHLNYNKFGDEVIRKVAEKTVNKIKFVNKTHLLYPIVLF